MTGADLNLRGIRTCEMCGKRCRAEKAVVLGHEDGVVLWAHRRCSGAQE